jgi:hypothetical protein
MFPPPNYGLFVSATPFLPPPPPNPTAPLIAITISAVLHKPWGSTFNEFIHPSLSFSCYSLVSLQRSVLRSSCSTHTHTNRHTKTITPTPIHPPTHTHPQTQSHPTHTHTHKNPHTPNLFIHNPDMFPVTGRQTFAKNVEVSDQLWYAYIA